MNLEHQPDPAFVSHLEWQVRTALRRRDRFARPAGPRVPRLLLTAALILLSLLASAAGVIAADRLKDARAKELFLARAQVEVEAAAARAEHLAAEASALRPRHAAGLVGAEELLGAEVQAEDASLELALRQLELREVEVTGREPRDDVAAPLAGGRDLAGERLRLRQRQCAARLEAARRRLERLTALRSAGLVEEKEVEAGAADVREAELAAGALAERLSLRERFLSGEIAAEQADARAQWNEARRDLEIGRLRLEAAQNQARRMAALVEAGHVSAVEAGPAEQAARELEARVRLLEVEVAIRRRRSGD